MATFQSRGSSIVSTVLTTWANTTNAYDGSVGTTPATYATWVNAARSTSGSITIGGYSFSGLTSGYTVNSVTADIRHIESNTTVIANVTVQLQDSSGTNIGSAVAATRTTSAHTDTLTLGTPTAAQAAAGLRVLVTVTRSNSTTSTTFSLDQVDLTVDATPPPVPTGDVIAQAMYKSDKRTPWAVGAATSPDGLTSDLYLNFLVANTNNQTASENYPGVEIRATNTAFTGTANYTSNSFLAQESAEPSAMRGSVMAYDAVNKRFIMTGGYDGSARYTDVWELDASGLAGKWRKLSPTGTGPAGKNLGGATMINQNGKAWFVYWGGNTGSDSNDLTILDCTTRGSEVWTTVTQTSAPTARSYQTLHLAYVPLTSTTGELYYFGGWASTRENNLVKFSVNTGSTVPTAVTWSTVSANGAAGAPPGRSGCILFHDATNNRLIVHGGYTTTGVSDTWAWSLSGLSWSQLSPTGTAPTGRELFAAAYDPTSKRLVVAGGWTSQAVTANLNDIYQLDFSSSTNGVFTQLKAHNYPNCDIDPFSSVASAYDSNRRMMATSGLNGYDGTDRYSYAFDFTETVAANAMTLYGLNIVDWQRARDAPAYAKDTDANEFLMINGFSGMADDTLNASALNGDHMNEIWVYSPTANTVRYGNQGIFGQTYREGVFACYDPVGQRILCFGGLTGSTQVSGDVWELKRDTYGNYKARQLSPGGTWPDPRWLMAGGFDATNNRMIVWGGSNKSAMEDNQLHILDFSGGGDGSWSAVTGGGTTPPVVWQPAYANDTANKKLYVLSGATNFGASTFSTRLDYLDYSTSTPSWVNVNTTGVTGGRGMVMAYDEVNNALTAFGGYNGSVVNNNNYELTLSSSSAWTSPAESTSVPGARRSAAAWRDTNNDGMLVTSGRPVSGTWFRDFQLYTPAYSYGIAGWFDRSPKVYLADSIRISGLTNNTAYHWQAINTAGSSPSIGTFTATFGSNQEHVADFYLGTPTTQTTPSVTTSAATNIAMTSFTANGNVTADGGGASRGFVWTLATNADPTISTNQGSVTDAGLSTGTYSASITGLSLNTAYKVRAWATNGSGTVYGSTVTVTTLNYSPTSFNATAILSNTGGGTTYVTLWNRTDNVQVSGTEMSTASSTPTYVSIDFELGVTGFADLKDYEFRVKASSGTANVYSVMLYARLKNLTKAMTYNRVSRFGYQALASAAAATSERWLYTASNYSSPTAAWEITGTEDTNGTNNFQLYNVTTTDSGTTGSGVAGTSVDVNSTSKVRSRITGVSLVDTNRYMGIFNFTSGGARYHQGIVAVGVSGTAGTVNLATNTELLASGRNSLSTGTFTPINSYTPFTTLDYDGTVNNYFEVIGTNSNTTTAYAVTLVAINASAVATDVTSVTMTANTGSSNVRYRSGSITIPSDTVALQIRIPQTASASQISVQGARIVTVQSSANRTRVQIPMGGSNNAINDDTSFPIVTVAQTTYATLATNVDQFTIWHRDDSEFATYSGVATGATITTTHTTSAVKRKQSTVSHTTSANKKKSGTTVSHTTSANKKKTVTTSHTTDSYLTVQTKAYSRANSVSIPTNDTNLSTIYNSTDYTNVATSNDVRVGIVGADYILHQFKDKSPSTSYNANFTWEGQSTLDPFDSPIYLEVYNRTSGLWEVIDFNDVAAANTDITLSGGVNANLSNYYDAGGWISARVRQYSI